MKIALIGYGKMGKTIDGLATARGHSIVGRMDSSNKDDWSILNDADIAIEFTNPEAAQHNISNCIARHCPVVSGSTGWYSGLAEIEKLTQTHNGAFLYASNFSVGVNLFMAVNRFLAELMNEQEQYDVRMIETHHTEKLDAPSGTAITLAEDIVQALDRKQKWVKDEGISNDELPITSNREPDVPGTHTIVYQSKIDDIRIEHSAHSRDGFALGAIAAAEWLIGKTGVYTMKDVLNLNHKT